MVKKGGKSYTNEFPVLDEIGLYASSTKGDGNCLFRALSDQVYGDESHHSEIRQNVMAYVEKEREHFAPFVGEFGETFEQYISRLRQDGVYGGDIEITGFADRYSRTVVVYQADSLYVIEPRESKSKNGSVHIAYHTWEHYSSVRKKGCPTGAVEIDLPGSSSIPFNVSKTDDVPSWQVDLILKSVPDASTSKVIEMLQTKDVDTVIEELLMEQYDSPKEDPTINSSNDSGTKSKGEKATEKEEKAEKKVKKNKVKNKTKGNATAKNDKSKEVTTSAESSENAKSQGDSNTEPSPKSSTEKASNDKTSNDKPNDANPAPKVNRKEAARQRRLEKKERVRLKKTKATAKAESSSEKDSSNKEVLSAKVIHI